MVLTVRDMAVRRRDHDISCPDIDLPAGGSLALAGASGAGKTSILLALAGILRPHSGRIDVAGTGLWALSEESRAVFRGRSIGYVFASFHLVDALDVIGNLQLAPACAGLPDDPERAHRLLDRLGIGALHRQRADRLSQGQMQRVAIARALMNRPKLLLCDEPTAALDPSSAMRLIDLLRDAADGEGAALIVATHDPRVMDAMGQTLHIASEVAA